MIARLYRATLQAALASAAALLSHAATFAHAEPAAAVAQPPAFSAMAPGGALAPWQPVTIMIGKRATRYDLVADGGGVVLHAVADNAASALAYPLDIELGQAPVIAWRWKIAALIPGADPYRASHEDAPARIVLEFDGDRSKLSWLERGVYRIAHEVAGRELPYATLMYVWANRAPVGAVIANPRTRRIQMIVASSGAAGVGAWQSLVRDARADFRRAFGEEPGRLLAIGVLTDTDNTDGHAEAWYGDIRLEPSPH